MTRTTTLALCIGALIGFAGAQLLPQAHATAPETIIKTENGVIAFIVAGQEKARIDATGLHVRDEIAYGGSLTDTGREYFDDYVKNSGGRDAP